MAAAAIRSSVARIRDRTSSTFASKSAVKFSGSIVIVVVVVLVVVVVVLSDVDSELLFEFVLFCSVCLLSTSAEMDSESVFEVFSITES
ncbi:unnamed protein product [Schistosoma curassoni]|uniref:Ovule protein n=1 Tax=Schistosoma curassoni TaxID=6186 RepID=A0A183K1U5_9TREM|nr:unnamed protein product [Schistosoma curassoni]